MIDPQRDELISLSDLARHCRSTNGGHVNPATTFRWSTKGLKGHKLAVVHIGGRMLTTWKSFLDFSAAVAAARASTPTPTRRASKRIKNARQVLQAAGISG